MSFKHGDLIVMLGIVGAITFGTYHSYKLYNTGSFRLSRPVEVFVRDDDKQVNRIIPVHAGVNILKVQSKQPPEGQEFKNTDFKYGDYVFNPVTSYGLGAFGGSVGYAIYNRRLNQHYV